MSYNIWNEENTKKLIELRGIKYSKFFNQHTSIKKKLEGWNIIKENLSVNFTTKQIATKWRLLLNRYKDIQTSTNKSEESKKNSSSSWPYYDLMNSIIKDQFTTSSSYLSDLTFGHLLNDENFINDLSSDSDTYFKQESQTVNNSNVEEEMNKLCGEIFATTNFLLSFKCYLCSKNLANISEFSNHLQKSHLNLISYNLTNDKTKEFENMTNIFKSKESTFDFETVLVENFKNDPYYLNNITSFSRKFNSFELTESSQNDQNNCFKSKEENDNITSNAVNQTDNSLSEESNREKCLSSTEKMNNNKKFQCNLCTSSFALRKQLNAHLKRHCNRGHFKCAFCVKTFSSIYEKSKHEKTKQHEKDWAIKYNSCEFCKECIEVEPENDNHKKTCSIHKIILNSNCTLTKDLKNDQDECLRRNLYIDKKDKNSSKHFKSNIENLKTNMKEFKCSLCSSTFALKKQLNSHIKRHINRGKFKCTVCKMGFSTMYEKVKHQKTKRHIKNVIDNFDIEETNKNISIKKSICQLCKINFETKSERDDHQKSCTASGINYSCEICYKTYEKKAVLVKHLKIHKDVRPHKCHICQKSFLELTVLKSHIRRHLGEKEFQCQYCEKRFVSLGEQKIHEMGVHKGEKPFLCTECGKSFVTSSHLSVHRKRHSGTKLYKCDQCEMSFISSGCLKRHSFKHSGLRPYICEICNATFSRRSGLRAHKNLHLEVGTYCCQICSKRFKQHAGLYSHMKSHNVAKS